MVDWNAVRAYRAALRDLHANQEHEIAAGITHETDTYLRLNARVSALVPRVPWILR
ncbi:hypothetical protein [Nocardiopsis halophila]|uniref:hypothetical protein n=1 Tax=Nocardiopsis halophila TaxID=141692 RepID=UPI0003483B8A|nr:hypothetical protein [Nocardiopsis halophila]